MTNPTILLLDDNLLLGFEIAQNLKSKKMSVMGPFSNTRDAMSSLESNVPDAAILDINMGDGTTSLSFADTLTEKGLPFVFLTGYGSGGVIPDRFSGVQVMRKPIRQAQVLETIEKLLT
jgi:two-component SAPR family response regulator